MGAGGHGDGLDDDHFDVDVDVDVDVVDDDVDVDVDVDVDDDDDDDDDVDVDDDISGQYLSKSGRVRQRRFGLFVAHCCTVEPTSLTFGKAPRGPFNSMGDCVDLCVVRLASSWSARGLRPPRE